MLATTTDELNTIFRREAKDVLEGYDSTHVDSENLWSNAEIYQYMTEAGDQFARRTQSWLKTYTWDVTAGDPLIPLPLRLLKINTARMVTGNYQLLPKNTNEMGFGVDCDYGLQVVGRNAMFEGSGSVQYYIRDYEQKALRLVRIPAEDNTIEAQCTVTLAMPLSEGMMLPLREAVDQRLLLHYMKWLAFSKLDADAFDENQASKYQNLWENGIEDRGSEMRRYRRHPGVMQFSW